MDLTNNNSRPVILLGSNRTLWYHRDLFEKLNIKIYGLIDSDYYGNTDHIDGIPVIDTEKSFDDPEKLELYKSNFNFFLVVNWTGEKKSVQSRVRNKRQMFIDIIDQHDLPCLSIIDPSAVVHPTNKIGKNVLIDAFAFVSGYNIISDYASIYAYAAIGHHNHIGKNCVIQRQAGVHTDNVLEENVYVGLSCQVFGENLTLKSGTVIHPCLAVNRSTEVNEIVSLAGKDLRRIYPYIQNA